MKDRNRQDDEAHERLVMAISLGRLVADIRQCPQTLLSCSSGFPTGLPL
jgi:hypothetical protein